jgi:hypothetical protein
VDVQELVAAGPGGGGDEHVLLLPALVDFPHELEVEAGVGEALQGEMAARLVGEGVPELLLGQPGHRHLADVDVVPAHGGGGPAQGPWLEAKTAEEVPEGGHSRPAGVLPRGDLLQAPVGEGEPLPPGFQAGDLHGMMAKVEAGSGPGS